MKIPTPRRRGDGWRIEVCVKGTRDSRHEASTQLAKALENPMDLAKVTGHKDLKTLLNVYYNPTGDELAEKLRAKK